MELKLPLNVVGYADTERLSRTLEGRDAAFISAVAMGQTLQQEVTDKSLLDLAGLNGIDLMDRRSCQQLKAALQKIAEVSPKLRISFAVEPSPKVIATLLQWFRANIHPGILLDIGLQPNLAAGCILRTPNKIFDFSLENYIKQQNPYLVQLIKGSVNAR